VDQRNLQNPELGHHPREECNESTKTEVSLAMAKRGTIKQPHQIVVEMTLGRSEVGAAAKHIRHHRKTFWKFTQLLRVSEEEESPARLVKPMQGE
jgi:hypothetical protein